MLVLSRKLGEKIVVPDSALSVAVVGISGNTVRLGISAPPQIGVYRQELLDAIRDDDKADAKSDQGDWDELPA